MLRQAEHIIEAAARIPFTDYELQIVMAAIKTRRAKGTDLTMGHPMFTPEPEAILNGARDGFIFVHSPEQLGLSLLFVKLNAGRSLLGKQKAVYASHLASELGEDEWAAGATFKSWPIAVTAVGNIYRASGYR